jgi:CRP-like cAMP-binding protein
VRITKVVGAAEMIFAVLKPGDIFGEMAILESQPRSANAIAAEHSICMVMDMKTLIDSASTQTKIIEKLTTVLAERIWFSYKQLSNANIDDPIGRIYDGLAMYLEKAFIDEFEKHSFIFDFTPADFLKMTKTTDNEAAMSELIRNKILVVRGNKLATDNTMEIFKQRMYYRNAQARQKKLSKKPDASSAQ